MRGFKNFCLNLPIRIKILCSIGITVILFMLLLIINSFISKTVSEKYEQAISGAEYRYSVASDINALISDTNKEITAARYNYKNSSALNIAEENIYNNLDDIIISVELYRKSSRGVYASPDDDYIIQTAITDDIVETYDKYSEIIDLIIKHCHNNDLEALIKTDMTIAAVQEEIDGYIDELMYISYEESKKSTSDAYDMSVTSSLIMIVLGTVVCFMAIVLGLIISSFIVKPIKRITSLSTNAAEGNFDIDFNINTTDEIGKLSDNIISVIYGFKDITNEVSNIYSNIEKGSLSDRINTDNYKGAYKDTVEAINQMLNIFESDTWSILNSIKEYAGGNFKYKTPEFQGEKAEFQVQLDIFKNTLKSINSDLLRLITEVISGNLTVRADSSIYTGDWRDIIENLNKLVSTVEEPINKTCKILKEVENANFNVYLDGDFKGNFQVMQNAINSTIQSLKIYIKNISEILTKMAEKDLNVSIDIEYKGDFNEIKSALTLIINNFNILIEQIDNSAEQVSAGANSIADTSNSLAIGASTQSASLNTIVHNFEKISEQSKYTSTSTVEANQMTNVVKNKIETENNDMDNMVEAMSSINEASLNIENIISVIEEIAFQTNLLALNAAIEAARAGSFGKGFSVVADEVRSLALRSNKAVKETAELINTTIEKVDEGTQIANNAAKQLKEISGIVDNVAEIINNVNNSSQQQYHSLTDIKTEVTQINKVVTNNSSMSEEAASAAEELTSMVSVLKGFISEFNLKNQ